MQCLITLANHTRAQQRCNLLCPFQLNAVHISFGRITVPLFDSAMFLQLLALRLVVSWRVLNPRQRFYNSHFSRSWGDGSYGP